MAKRRARKRLPKTVAEFDRRFDAGESVFELGVSKEGWTRPGLVSSKDENVVKHLRLDVVDPAS